MEHFPTKISRYPQKTMDRSEFFESYKKTFEANGLSSFCGEEIMEKMFLMTEYMLEVNKVMNLTAITDPDVVVAKHLADSALASNYIPQGATLCDVGCGGGFPSLPLAIARPDLKITGVDSTEKRINYVNDAAKRLGLTNLTAISGRAEDLSREPRLRESFDVCIARAVASLPVLSELCIPFVKPNGLFIAMKGKLSDEEITKAPPTLGAEELDSSKAKTYDLITPSGSESRSMVILKKLSSTSSKYPRNYSQIKKKPL